MKMFHSHGERNNQSLKGAVVGTHCQNEAELKLSMEIDQHTENIGSGLVWTSYHAYRDCKVQCQNFTQEKAANRLSFSSRRFLSIA